MLTLSKYPVSTQSVASQYPDNYRKEIKLIGIVKKKEAILKPLLTTVFLNEVKNLLPFSALGDASLGFVCQGMLLIQPLFSMINL